MNCLNFVFRPAGFSSRDEMDALYNWHVRRFYDSSGYRKKFVRRIWEHRWSLLHVLRNTGQTLRAALYFSANRAGIEASRREFPRHPRQPQGLQLAAN
jgi:hypothetical protein